MQFESTMLHTTNCEKLFSFQSGENVILFSNIVNMNDK